MTGPEDDALMWAGDDELDGPPPLDIRKGRATRFKHAKAPHWVLLMTALPHNAFRLYGILMAHANQERGDGRVWPTEQTLAELMGYARRQSIIPLVKILEDLDLLEVESVRYGTNNSRQRNVYTVHEEPAKGWEGIANLQEWYAARKAVAAAAAAAEKKRPAPAASNGGVGAGSPGTNGSRVTSALGKGGGRRARETRPAAARGAGARMNRAQAAAVKTVEAAWPAPLAERLPAYRPPVLRDTILAALDGRTVEQLVERVRRRWDKHGWSRKHEDGEIESYVAVAVALVRPSKDCPDASCEDGLMIDSGELCRACQTRRTDHRRDRRRGVVPEQRDSGPPPERQECAGPQCSTVWAGDGSPPEDWMCRSCREQTERDEQEAAAAAEHLRLKLAEEQRAVDKLQAQDDVVRELEAAEEARARELFGARGLWGERLDWAVTCYMGAWRPGHTPDVDEVAAAAELATA